MTSAGKAINSDQIQRPVQQVIFLGVILNVAQWDLRIDIKEKLLTIVPTISKKKHDTWWGCVDTGGDTFRTWAFCFLCC